MILRQLLVSAYRASQYKEGIRRRATFDELVSTGNIGLVRDNTVRDTAMRVFTTATFDNLVREGVNSRDRAAFRMALPNEVQRALGKHCGDRYIAPGDYSRIHGVLDYPCTSGLPPDVVAADIETRLFDVTSNQKQLWETLRRNAGPHQAERSGG